VQRILRGGAAGSGELPRRVSAREVGNQGTIDLEIASLGLPEASAAPRATLAKAAASSYWLGVPTRRVESSPPPSAWPVPKSQVSAMPLSWIILASGKGG
jgi:hypothetical protein